MRISNRPTEKFRSRLQGSSEQEATLQVAFCFPALLQAKIPREGFRGDSGTSYAGIHARY